MKETCSDGPGRAAFVVDVDLRAPSRILHLCCILLPRYSCNLKGLQLPILYEQAPVSARTSSMRVRPPIRTRATCFGIPATSGIAAPHLGSYVWCFGLQAQDGLAPRPRRELHGSPRHRPSDRDLTPSLVTFPRGRFADQSTAVAQSTSPASPL